MEIPDIKPNTSEYKNREKKVEKMVSSNEVIVKKKSEVKKFSETFLGSGLSDIKEFLVKDVVIPKMKDLLYDLVSDGIGMALYKDSRGRRPSSYNQNQTSYRTQYNKYTTQKRDYNNYTPERSKNTWGVDDIVVPNRGLANDILFKLADLARDYGFAAIADLYEMVDVQPNYTDYKWGWSDLNTARVEHVRDGYLLVLPKPEPIE